MPGSPYDSPMSNTPTPGPRRSSQQGWPRWALWAALGALLLVVLLVGIPGGTDSKAISYAELTDRVSNGLVRSVDINAETGHIEGVLTSGTKFTSEGPTQLPDDDLKLLRSKNVDVKFHKTTQNVFTSLLPILLPVLLIIGFFVWMQRRAQGQVGSIMQIGRSKARTYSSERPG